MPVHNGPVLITGGRGFLGRSLAQDLVKRGDEVIVMTRPRRGRDSSLLPDVAGVTYVEEDLTDIAAMTQLLAVYRVDSLYHLAAESSIHTGWATPAATFDTNIRGTWSLLEACRHVAALSSIVVSSSDKAYGESAELPYVEDTPLRGRAPYEASKSCVDIISQSFGLHFGLPIAVVRAGNFYGGGDLNWHRLVPGTLKKLFNGRGAELRSDGKSVRDYVYIDDAVDAFITLGSSLAQRQHIWGQAFNVASGCRLTVLEIVQMLTAAAGSSQEPVVGPGSSNEIQHQYLNTDKFCREFGWSPAVELGEAIERTAAWYRNFIDSRREIPRQITVPDRPVGLLAR